MGEPVSGAAKTACCLVAEQERLLGGETIRRLRKGVPAMRRGVPYASAIEAYAERHAVPVSEAMRLLIEAGLKRPLKVKA
jgi:hypothetical protein